MGFGAACVARPSVEMYILLGASGIDSQEAVVAVDDFGDTTKDHDHANREVGKAEEICELRHDGGCAARKVGTKTIALEGLVCCGVEGSN